MDETSHVLKNRETLPQPGSWGYTACKQHLFKFHGKLWCWGLHGHPQQTWTRPRGSETMSWVLLLHTDKDMETQPQWGCRGMGVRQHDHHHRHTRGAGLWGAGLSWWTWGKWKTKSQKGSKLKDSATPSEETFIFTSNLTSPHISGIEMKLPPPVSFEKQPPVNVPERCRKHRENEGNTTLLGLMICFGNKLKLSHPWGDYFIQFSKKIMSYFKKCEVVEEDKEAEMRAVWVRKCKAV